MTSVDRVFIFPILQAVKPTIIPPRPFLDYEFESKACHKLLSGTDRSIRYSADSGIITVHKFYVLCGNLPVINFKCR